MKIGIVGNTTKKEFQKTFEKLVDLLIRKNAAIFANKSLQKFISKEKRNKIKFYPIDKLSDFIELLITIGGDGTILNSAQIVLEKQIPIFGINLGKLGFLADTFSNEIDKSINLVLQKKFFIENRNVLQTKIGKKTFYAINDFVLDKGSSFRLVEIKLYVDNNYAVTYAADGIIISTPTGSTAYSLAAQGPIIFPTCEVIEITPICPHNLAIRPFIVSNESKIKLKVATISKEKFRLSLDGQIEKYFSPPFEIEIQTSKYTMQLVKFSNNYFEALRNKLMLGKRYLNNIGK